MNASRHAHRGEYVEVYSDNISTHYAEVFWTMMPEIPLPKDFVARFDGQPVAFTGYEADALRTLPDGTEEHVPLYDAYNHHHNAYIYGKKTTLVDVGHAGTARTPGHGGQKARWEPRDKPLTTAQREQEKLRPSEVQGAAWIVDGNGGEYRMSLHGTAQGSAMLVESPANFAIQPMMINTKNPNGRGPGNWELMPPGAYGANAKSFHTAPEHSLYSPLLECPCTDRKPRLITRHDTLEKGVCGTQLESATDCFRASAALGLLPIVKNATVQSATTPHGCYVLSTKAGFEVFYNSDGTSKAQCGPSHSGPVRSTGASIEATSGVEVKIDLDAGSNCNSSSHHSFTSDLSGTWAFNGHLDKGGNSAPYSVTFAAVAGHPGSYSISNAGAGAGPCKGGNSCAGTLVGSTFTMTKGFKLTAVVASDWASLTWSNGAPWSRGTPTCPGLATITLSGPSGLWFGAGFDAETMADKPYTLIVDGKGAVTERRMGKHDAGTQLSASVKVVSSTVVSGRRTVVVERPLAGATTQHLTFDPAATGLPYIAAIGSTPELSYHKARGGGDLMLVEAGAPLCICTATGTPSGSIDGVAFNKKCAEMPRSSLLVPEANGGAPNDVCSIETYQGGLACCAHETILLSDTQVPWSGGEVPTDAPVSNVTDNYRMKFRLYYEPYTNQSNAFFMFITDEAGAGEYDIPQCPKGTPVEECVHTLTGDFLVRDSMHKCNGFSDPFCSPGWNESSDVELLRAGTHCHAPACINETLYNLDTGEVICYNEPLYGEGVAPSSGQHFNEAGYAVGIPPCLWGSEAEGLLPSPRVGLNTRLRSVKHVNNTCLLRSMRLF